MVRRERRQLATRNGGMQGVLTTVNRFGTAMPSASRPPTGKRKLDERGIKQEYKSNDAKRYRRVQRDFSKARCGECGELGHTTNFHDRFVAKQQGMAHAARAQRGHVRSVVTVDEETGADDAISDDPEQMPCDSSE
ncbi:hypothetical protein PHYSODRAFT_300603 [Phytophthora sojae]|uniref:Uncharacterized protein n=1 Tax=Phytophthora sojae (strain P6497) TaxID=1094619 RepID=G4ZGS8_PHYSP|nr:hypothetical protein PHYSODRAFT_300603 [Phytophthora sojae]EGZ17577.1 hypothetical protein PHYSODRAFT_300603 [Phytophthora sojae]|eukprot:XP_009526635.1 hypothetical protein PHYSODRAFT_300603 [Phytophthora sojae]